MTLLSSSRRAGRDVELDTEHPDRSVNRSMHAYPVLEVAILNIRPGQVAAFLDAFSRAEPIISAAAGYGGHELRRCAEDDHRFLLLVRWDSVQSHEVGFRKSAGYQQWRELLHRFYDPFPVVEHYLPRTEGGSA